MFTTSSECASAWKPCKRSRKYAASLFICLNCDVVYINRDAVYIDYDAVYKNYDVV